MKKIGIALLIVGLVGLIFFGIEAYHDSESFSLGGLDIAVSKANWTPIVFSGVVGILGLVLIIFSKRK